VVTGDLRKRCEPYNPDVFEIATEVVASFFFVILHRSLDDVQLP